MIEGALNSELDAGACPHVAVILRSRDELPGVLASFYALGAKRGGYLVHRSMVGEADEDRAALAGAGLDVDGLERAGRFATVELSPDTVTPEEYADPWLRELERVLAEGFTGLWYSRYVIGPEAAWYDRVRPYEAAWDEAFHDRPVVQLCPFLVGELDAGATLDRLGRVTSMHGEGVLVPDGTGDGFRLLRPV